MSKEASKAQQSNCFPLFNYSRDLGAGVQANTEHESWPPELKITTLNESRNPIKRFYHRIVKFFRSRRLKHDQWLRDHEGIVKEYHEKQQQAQQKEHEDSPKTTTNSFYNLIKQILPSTAQARKSRESSAPASSSSEKVKGILDVSSPLLKEAWKEDAGLILADSYAAIGNTQFLGKYTPLSIIGQGSFGFVLKAKKIADGSLVAVKFIFRQNINQAAWILNPELGLVPSEVHFLHSLSHPGIVKFLDCFDDGKYVLLVTEFHGTSWSLTNPELNPRRNRGLKSAPSIADHTLSKKSKEESPCDLFECIEAHNYLPEETIHFIFTQLYDVVKYLASNGVVHRDLKDENLVVDADYRIKIIDFGSATAIPRLAIPPSISDPLSNEGWFDKFNGTLAFAPPEVIRGLRYKGSESEVWTLGILLFTMAFRQSPFTDSQAILYGRLDFPFEEDEPGK